MLWFTSDTHFGHANVLRYDNRPFQTIEEHDAALIERWNATVHPGDVVYHLGDVAWHTRQGSVDVLLAQLHGTKILITGNHDGKYITSSAQWAKVTPYYEVTWQTQKIVLFHYRMVVWNRSHYGSWALHGHSHGTLPVNLDAKTLDVGTMCWGYAPVSVEQIAETLAQHRTIPVDGHRNLDL